MVFEKSDGGGYEKKGKVFENPAGDSILSKTKAESASSKIRLFEFKIHQYCLQDDTLTLTSEAQLGMGTASR